MSRRRATNPFSSAFQVFPGGALVSFLDVGHLPKYLIILYRIIRMHTCRNLTLLTFTHHMDFYSLRWSSSPSSYLLSFSHIIPSDTGLNHGHSLPVVMGNGIASFASICIVFRIEYF